MAGSPVRSALVALAAVLSCTAASGQTNATLEGRLAPPLVPERAEFGSAVSIDGDTAVVGAPRDDVNGESSGSVFVYTRSAAGWTLRARITPLQGTAGDRFGRSVDLENGLLVVGAPNHSYGAERAGAVFVFEGQGSVWVQRQRLSAPEQIDEAWLGFSVALRNERILAGAPREHGLGAAYLFERRAMGFVPTERLAPHDLPPLASFGIAVDVGDAALVVGAYLGGPADSRPGAAYVYGLTPGGSWTAEARLGPTDPQSFEAFGASVALDGETIVVGAPERRSPAPQTGTAYVFQRGAGAWDQATRLRPAFPHGSDAFGAAVALRAGDALVGAPGDDATGTAYLFRATAGWQQTTQIVGSPPSPGERLGIALALTDGACIVGANQAAQLSPQGGTAYVLALEPVVSGLVHCTGDDPLRCPCANPGQAGEGCRHSGGRGMRIAAAGTPSFSAADLQVLVLGAPRGNAGTFLAGTASLDPGRPFHDGLLCVGGDLLAFCPQIQWEGAARAGGFLSSVRNGPYFQPGLTYHFQYWTRDLSHGPSPCGRHGNLSPAVSVRLTP